MARGTLTPLGAIVKGAIAGAIGTAAMDAVWYYRYKKGGGEQNAYEWEFSDGLQSFETAPAPALVGKRLYEGMLQRELKPERARTTNNIVHWATGIGWGAVFGILAGSTKRRALSFGLPLGAGAWAASYAALAPAGLYRPMFQYDAQTLWKDLSAHLAFGTGTAVAFKALAGSE